MKLWHVGVSSFDLSSIYLIFVNNMYYPYQKGTMAKLKDFQKQLVSNFAAHLSLGTV